MNLLTALLVRIGAALALLILGTANSQALAPPNQPDIGYAIQTVANEGRLLRSVDFDLDRFERAHVALLESSAQVEPQSRAMVLRYVRFDGVVWRNLVLATLNTPIEFEDGEGRIAVALTQLQAAAPTFNVLVLDRGGPSPTDDRLLLFRYTATPGAATSEMEIVFEGAAAPGVQLVAASDGTLHALWLDPGTQQIRHAQRDPTGQWRFGIASGTAAAPSSPAIAMSASGRLVMGFVEAGAIQLREWDTNTWQAIAAPALSGVRAPIAVHFRANGEIGVAAASNQASDLHYVIGTAEAFPAPGVPLLIGLTNAFRLLNRQSLPNAEGAASPGWLAIENAGEPLILSLPNGLTLESQNAIGGSPVGIALRDGRRYALAFDVNGHRDIQLHVRGRQWQTANQPIAPAGSVLAQVNDADGSPIVLLRATQGMQLARWSEASNGFMVEDLPSTVFPSSSEAVLGLSVELPSGTTRLSIALHHPISRRLQVVERANSQPWQLVYSDPGLIAGSGRQPQLAIDDSGRRFVLHSNFDGADQLLLTHFGPDFVATTEVLSATMADLSLSRARMAVVPESGDVFVSYFQASAGNLRLLRRRPTGALVGETVALNDVTTGEHHAITTDAIGQPALAYSVRQGIDRGLRYRFFRRTQLIDEVLRPVEPNLQFRDLAISLKNQNAELARVAHVQDAGVLGGANLFFAQRRVGFSPSVPSWRAQRFNDFGVPTTDTAIALNSDWGDRLFVLTAATPSETTLSLAQRISQADDLGETVLVPLPPVQRFGSSFACQCANDPLAQGSNLGAPSLDTCRLIEVGPIAKDVANSADATLFVGLRERFSTTPAGRYYLRLWNIHGTEIVSLTLRNPTELAQRLRTLADFAPGLAALVRGDAAGAQFTMTPDMLQKARRVWEGWRDNGSPALRRAMINELARLQNLTVFNNHNFTQWFGALSVGNADDLIFVNGFQLANQAAAGIDVDQQQ